MLDLKNEISRVFPGDQTIPDSSRYGIPILKAFECVLHELETDNGFIYTAVNINTGKSLKLSRQSDPLPPPDIEKMVERIHLSHIAGAGRLEVERSFGKRIEINKALEILSEVITGILPRSGYDTLPGQLTDAKKIMNGISHHLVIRMETEADADNVYAYLIPAVIAKLGRLNDFHNFCLYPEMAYVDMANMPIVITASSAALQYALIDEHIPELSRILLEAGVIKRPITAALRKGKGHYICEHNLRARLPLERDHDTRQILSGLLSPFASIDLSDADGLTPQVKTKISVPPRCLDSCAYKEKCRYLMLCEEVQSPSIDIQVCSHHYLLTDTLRRTKGKRSLIPNYQILIIAEAQRFNAAARSVYRIELSNITAPGLLESIDNTGFQYETARRAVRKSAKKLADENKKLFRGLTTNPTADLDVDAARHLRNIRDISERVAMILRGEVFRIKAGELLMWVQEKYDADISAVDLSRLVPAAVYDAPDIERQREIIRLQTNRFYQAICGLHEVKRGADMERNHRQLRVFGYNPARQTQQNEKSAVFDSIWNRARALLINDSVAGSKSEPFSRLIWEFETLRDQAAAFAQHGALRCRIEIKDNETRLYAVPKDLDKQLSVDLWSKGVPAILITEIPSAAASTAL